MSSASSLPLLMNINLRSPSPLIFDFDVHFQASDFGAILLAKQLKELIKNPVDGFSVGLVDDSDVYVWQIVIEGPPGTLLYVHFKGSISVLHLFLCLSVC
jgi:hypothetical protein